MARRKTETTTAPTPARTPARTPDSTPAATPAAPDRVRLISRYTQLQVGDIARFQGGRCTVTREEFDRLAANPAYGYGIDFSRDSTPDDAVAITPDATTPTTTTTPPPANT